MKIKKWTHSKSVMRWFIRDHEKMYKESFLAITVMKLCASYIGKRKSSFCTCLSIGLDGPVFSPTAGWTEGGTWASQLGGAVDLELQVSRINGLRNLAHKEHDRCPTGRKTVVTPEIGGASSCWTAFQVFGDSVVLAGIQWKPLESLSQLSAP